MNDRQLLTYGNVRITPGTGTPLGTFQRASFQLDQTPLWGPVNQRFGIPDTLAVQISGDTVTVDLSPGFNHAGFELHGFIRDGAVSGAWCERQYAGPCRQGGDFTMVRRSR